MTDLTIKQQSQPVSELAKKQAEIKAKYPDCVVLFREGETYFAVKEDAINLSEIGATVIKLKSGEQQAIIKPLEFDEYLTKLIRAGFRIVIV